MADYIVAKRWLLSLAQLAAIRLSHDEASAFIETVAPMLAMRFSNAALTPEALEAVAADCKHGLPSYGELVAPPSRPLAAEQAYAADASSTSHPPTRRTNPGGA